MSTKKAVKRLSQLGFVLFISFGLLTGLSLLLSGGGVQTAVAATNVSESVNSRAIYKNAFELAAVIAVDDAYTATEEIPLTIPATGVLSNDSNGNTAYLLTQPANGAVVMAADGSFTYTSNIDFDGVDSFTYYAAENAPVPVAYWPFDDGVNPTLDATGLGFDAMINSGVTFTTAVPATLGSGQSLDFASNNGVVYAADDAAVLNLQTLTASFWVNIDTMSSYSSFLNKGYRWRVRQFISTGRISFITDGPSNYNLIGNIAIDDGQWHHVAVVYDGVTKSIYIDGVLDVSVAATGAINYFSNIPLRIGDLGFDGRLDDLRLYQGGLTQAEVQAAMAGSLPAVVDIATVTMNVTNVNDPVTAMDDWFVGSLNETLTVPAIGVLANDVDVDSVLSAVVDTPPAVGSLTLNGDGGFAYTPPLNATGPISYSYIASDGFFTDTATVTMTFGIDQCYTYLDSSGQTYSNPSGYAIEYALTDALDGDLIKIAGNCINPLDADGNGRSIDIAQNITLQGGYTNTNWLAASNPTLYPTTLDGNNESRVLSIIDSTVTLDGLIVTGGYITNTATINDGGGIYVGGASVVSIENSQIISNTAEDEGGGIHIFSGIVSVTDSVINENYAGDDGSGLDIESGGVVTVTRTTIDNNIANDDGGGIESAGNLWLLDSSVNGNTGGDRAAIDGDGGVIIIARSVISGNITLDSGGTVDNDDIMIISDSLIQNNRLLDDDGGAIDNSDTLIITDTQIIDNYASDDCGGIYNDGTMTLTRVTIEGNEADNGGGLCVNYNDSAVIGESTIQNNIASVNGGGIYLREGSTLTMSNSTVYSNTAVQAGALFNDGGMVTLSNSTISGNSAQQDSALMIMQSGIVTPTMFLEHTTIVSNTASITDTAIGIYSGTLKIINSIVAYNGSVNCAFSGSGALSSGGYNLEDGNSCGLNVTGDMTNTNPLLAPLADNGGATKTHAPLPGSPVIDAIPVGLCTLATDQRGILRPFGAACDIGAMERGYLIYTPIIMK